MWALTVLASNISSEPERCATASTEHHSVRHGTGNAVVADCLVAYPFPWRTKYGIMLEVDWAQAK